MPTIQESIDQLDRMIDTNAQKHEMRSQLAFIAREVAVEQEACARLADTYAKLEQEHSKLKQAETKRNSDGWNALQKESEERQKMLRSKQLNYDA